MGSRRRQQRGRSKRIRRIRFRRRKNSFLEVFGPRLVHDEDIAHRFRPARILILGHSFIWRLEEYMLKSFGFHHNMGFSYGTAEIFFRGTGGRTCDRLISDDLPVVDELRPDIVYLEVGTNDLTDMSLRPETIGSLIEDFVTECATLNVGITIVGQTIFRNDPQDEEIYPKLHPEFNDRVIQLNNYNKVVLDPEVHEWGMYWRHIGLWHSSLPIIKPRDGVHLTGYGNFKLFKSIRGALVHGLRRINQRLWLW